MRETKRFQATTGGVQKDADVETAHIVGCYKFGEYLSRLPFFREKMLRKRCGQLRS